MGNGVKYPIGEQDFKNLRNGGNLYVDKTRFIDRMLSEGGKYYFLARPRRFGKSLFLSTLQYFFEGYRDLFQGLYIYSTPYEWKEYPVLHLDLNRERYAETGLLEPVLDKMFDEWEEKYDVKTRYTNPPQRFEAIIQAAHEKTGQQVVILVDEYDKPLVGNLNNTESFEHYTSKLAALYTTFKSASDHIRLVFLTGVTRFSKLSVFSDLNNIRDISFSNEYADICGITIAELDRYFQDGIRKLAEQENISIKECLKLLKENYDGYRFAERGSEIYNPWSLLNAMAELKIQDYWNDTGYPTIVAETLKRIDVDLRDFFDSYCSEKDLKGLDLLNPDPTALLYQTGYLTIKEYVAKIKRYRLGIPNNEVKSGMFDILLPYYVNTKSNAPNKIVQNIVTNFILGKPDKAMSALQTYFAGIDYALRIENENNFQNAFFLLMDLIGLETTVEAHTSDGRIDLEIKTNDFIYIIELKYDHPAEEALKQIELKKYGRKYQLDSRRLFMIGASFSSKTRCIEDWTIA